MLDLFVYGTLQSPALMQAVAGGAIPKPIAATLPEYSLRTLRDYVVPCLVSDPSGCVEGVVFRGLTPDQIARLDLYEGAWGYTLAPTRVDAATPLRDVYVYLPPAQGVAPDGPWSFADWQSEHEKPAVDTAIELFSHDPLPDPELLRQTWHMMESRAWAKHRAVAAPQTRRYAPDPGDVAIHKLRPPVGNFFRMQSMNVSHSTFQGTRTDPLRREVFVGVDAVILLPYDPVRDKVLLVEQVRMGPVIRRDPNPWMLEAVAGMVDARETPEAAGCREATEEAGVTLQHLEPAGSYYPSPGGTTDYFYTYVGLCDLPMTETYLGGLSDEDEDLRLHPMGFDEAMALTTSGEIATGPLFHLLYWLAWHRDRLGQFL
ncbi:gamma-glutamylcyclotransferase [Yoonia sp. BS5-3]|uniref:ADP-ribose pyrophosphatase n=1 Tax=Yoonia phaeophyticola TaxID=3137369 RepID=A0ABZ2V0F0_9RHOB